MANELYKIKEYLTAHTGPAGKALEKAVAGRWVNAVCRQVDQHHAAAGKVPSAPEKTDGDRIRVAVVVHSLIIGGGEIFPIQLANALAECDCSVMLINCGIYEENTEVRGMIGGKVRVRDLTEIAEIEDAVNEFRADVVHTHHAMLDLAVSRMIEIGAIKAKQVITLHGMYEALDDARAALLVQQMTKTASGYAYIAEKNLEPFRKNGASEEYIRSHFLKLPNGAPVGDDVTAAERAALGIPDDAFVLCLVSRAIFEKGWKEAIEAVQLANEHSDRPIHLILVGSGEAYDQLKDCKDPHIHFTGLQQNTRQYLAAADVGFLPSRYQGESFPLVIIDSLMCGKPVIATELGEIPAMLETPDGNAGWLFPLENGAVPVKDMARLIVGLINHPDKYKAACNCAVEAAKRYDIAVIAQQYLELYKKASLQTASAENAAGVNKCKILVSCHKPAQVLKNEVVTPIQVGCALRDDYFPDMLHDDQGVHISERNKSYCEVTAQYWAWKNVDADAYGFFHYRRYLNLSDREYHEDRYGNIYEPAYSDKLERKYGLDPENIKKLMNRYDVITVKARDVKDEQGNLMTVRQQYAAADYLHEEDLQTVLDIIDEKYPEYSKAAHNYVEGTVAYYCNMYILKKDLFHSYCSWLFPILEEFCRRTDMTGYTPAEYRTPGHLAERLWGIYYGYLKSEGKIKGKEAQSVLIANTDESWMNSSRSVNGIKRIVHRIKER